MDVSPALFCAAKRTDEGLVLEDLAARDGTVHALEILVEDPSRADGQVADLRVPHLARRQPDRLARGLESRMRILPPEPIEHGSVGELDGVARPGRRAAPAVEDDERDYREGHAWTIAANDSTSREAPPTSAPSIAGIAISSVAFSGFTEPP